MQNSTTNTMMPKTITDTDCCRDNDRLELLASLYESMGTPVERQRLTYYGDPQNYYRLVVGQEYIY